MSTLFKNSNELETSISYFRNCRLFKAKNINGKKLRYLFEGLSKEIARAEGKYQEISDEYDPMVTNELLSQWESAIGIPDDCIPLETSNEDRRNWILLKLTSLGVSTKAGFEALGAILGFTITVTPGQDALSFPYTFPFILSDKSGKWILFVSGPISPKSSILKCLFEKLVPSNVNVIFNLS